MGLFQKSVLNKYLKEANDTEMQLAYQKLLAYFHNPIIQQNIRDSKEEQFQEGFLTELFAKVLGYTINPNPDYNLTTEFKNERGARKADGAILKEAAAIGVIELKSTTTKDLESIRLQAFDYKANQRKCVYVVTSNFEKLRFYIQNAVDFEEFDLFKITYEQFRLLWLCLAKTNLMSGVPLAMKEASLLKEEDITKQFYLDYSAFKRDLYNDLVANNLNLEIFSENDEKESKLLLFKKSQKLLDRFLFVFFGEDRGLLPPNSISEIIGQWENQSDWGDDVRLYSRYKKYFALLNTGWKGKKYEIFAYNGGLFAPDEVLDSIEISDEILKKHTRILTGYDFETDVDVNILGHIFENSLNEIEEITAQIEGAEIDLKKSRRKKDGVFYTPKYITKYIVDNTVGNLCTEKRSELGIDENEYLKSRKGRTTKKLKEHDDKLTDYRNWLLALTICDPACGSGAFLNQALDFLIREHRYINELRAQLLDVPMIFTEVENSILENNIYGVDINDESVEIAKLSLWLRTAQKGRKLTSLNNNIKCGNSLIDNPKLAGEKAFSWQTEFPEVFKRGGFDVVIGNPPYVQLQTMGEMSNSLSKSGYQTYNKSADLYCLFYERGCQILKPKGFLSYITSNKWLRVNYGESLRRFLTTKVNPTTLIDFPGIPVFADAVVDPHILILTNEPYQGKTEACAIKTNTVDLETVFELNKTICKFSAESWTIMLPDEARKLEQMKLNSIKLKDLPISIYRGILTGYNEAFYIDECSRKSLIDANPKSVELIKPMLRGRDISPYGISGSEYLISTFPSLKLDIDNYPAIKNHLLSFGFDRLKQTGEKGARKKTNSDWYETQDTINYYKHFAKPKIMYPNMTSVFPFMYDESGFLSNDKSFILTANFDSFSLLFLTAVFNSSLAKLWIWYNCPELGDNRREIRKVYFEHFPVPQANHKQQAALAQFAKERTQLTSDFQKLTTKFERSILRKFNIEKLTGKMQNWYLLSYAEFIKELGKKKVKLSLSEEAEWEDYFNEQKGKAQTLNSEINKTDREIDRMVYELYGLSEGEIEIVEGSN
jgi:type I restriction-modification system DNA methylase subunit